MAITNEELAQAMAQASYELDAFGKMTATTADRLRDAKVGVEGFSKAVREAPQQIGKAAKDMAGAMYKGEQGAKAFNSSVDSMADAASSAATVLSAMIPGGPAVKALILGITKLAQVAIKAGAELQKAAGDQGDATLNTYRKLAEVGAAGGDGLSGLAEDARKAGLNILDMSHYAAKIAESAPELALYAGTVDEGRKRFADMNAELFKSGERLERLGYSSDAQITAAAAYMRLQQRMGFAQEKSAKDMGQAAIRYIEEQDRLTKITGLTREQQEKSMEAAMRNQRYAAAIDMLRDQNNEKAAKQMMVFQELMGKLGPTTQKGFQDMAAGMGLTSDEAAKAFQQSGGTLLEAANKIRSGAVKDDEELARLADQVARGMANFNKTIGRSSAALGTMDEAFGSYADGRNAEQILNKGFAQSLKDAKASVEAQVQGVDEQLKVQTNTVQKQRQTMVNSQEAIQMATLQAAKNVNALATAAEAASDALVRLAGGKGGTTGSAPEGGATVPAGTPNTAGMTAVGGGYAKPTGAAGFDMRRYLQATALVESGGDRGARAKTSTAGGMFQFTEGTWKATVKAMGKNYSLEDRFDPKKAAEVMAFFTQQQKAQLEKGTGQSASAVDLYMAHFLGAGGATKFINAMYQNPNSIAAQLFPEAAKANESIFFNKKTNQARTLIEVYDLMAGKMTGAESALAKGKWGGKDISADVTDLPQFARGGIANMPDSGGLARLHGSEAVVPLPDGRTIPVMIKNDLTSVGGSSADMDGVLSRISQEISTAVQNAANSLASNLQLQPILAALEELARYQRENVDVNERMLRNTMS